MLSRAHAATLNGLCLLLAMSVGGSARADPALAISGGGAERSAPLWGGEPEAAAPESAANTESDGETGVQGEETSTDVALMSLAFGLSALVTGSAFQLASLHDAELYHELVHDGHGAEEREEEAATIGFLSVGLFTTSAILLGVSCYCWLSGDHLGVVEGGAIDEQEPAPQVVAAR